MNSPSADLARKMIVALDVPSRRDATRLVEQLSSRVSIFKIGLQLFTAEGPEVVRAVRDTGARIFLDLKLHDIPNTVARTVEAIGALGVEMTTIHLCGGRAMIEAAVAARGDDLTLIGVTVLTSVDQTGLRETGVEGELPRQVERLARLGVESGVRAFVASSREVKMLREQFGPEVKLVIPGVRPSWSETNDQKRVMTPAEALQAGADYLVIGRPVTAHRDPAEAMARICDDLR